MCADALFLHKAPHHPRALATQVYLGCHVATPSQNIVDLLELWLALDPNLSLTRSPEHDSDSRKPDEGSSNPTGTQNEIADLIGVLAVLCDSKVYRRISRQLQAVRCLHMFRLSA